MQVKEDGATPVAEKTRPNICHLCMKKDAIGKELLYCSRCKIAQMHCLYCWILPSLYWTEQQRHACKPGQYSLSGASACIACPSNSYLPEASRALTVCVRARARERVTTLYARWLFIVSMRVVSRVSVRENQKMLA